MSHRYQIEKKSQKEINNLLLNKFEVGRGEALKEATVPALSRKDGSSPSISYIVSNLARPLPC